MKNFNVKIRQDQLEDWKKMKGSNKHPDSSSSLFQENPPLLQALAQRFEGKLLLKEEITLPTTLFDIFVAEGYFASTPAIHFSPISKSCVRCHNRKKHLFGTIPCSRCGKTHIYCRNCIEMGRVLSCESLFYWTGPTFQWLKMEDACTWKGTLSDAQRHGSNQISKVIKNKGKLLVWAVAGAGKTEMLFPGLTVALKEGYRICIASPRSDVVRELLPRLRQAFDGIPIQGLYSGSPDKSGTAQIIITTTHQLLRYQRAFDVTIIDELDAFPYHQDKGLQFAAKRAMKKTSSLIYLTATPREKQRMQMALNKLDYIFVPVRFHGHPLIIPNWIYCPQLQKEFQENRVPDRFHQWISNNRLPKRQILIFLPTIKAIQTLYDPIQEIAMKENLIDSPAEITSVHAEDEQRKEKVLAFREKKLKVILTTTILERGVTFPSVDVIILHAGHEVFDEAALIQIAGRAGRSASDPVGEVVFFHDGKTNAMVRANEAIKDMNKRAKSISEGGS